MTTVDRTAPDHRLVVRAEGTLAEFNRAGVLDPVDLHTAMTLGRMLAEPDESVLLALALAVRGTRYGHVCIDLLDIRDTVAVDGVDPAVVAGLSWPTPSEWTDAVARSPIVSVDGDAAKPLVLDHGRLYLQRYHDYEQGVLAALRAKAAVDVEGIDNPAALALRLLGPDSEATQRAAVEAGLSGGLTVVAGGPGTGKTYTVARILAGMLQAAVETGQPMPSVALAAPTGKAAARMTDQIRDSVEGIDVDAAVRDAIAGYEASTLHRLLGWHHARGRFRHGVRDPLPHDAVIVDEMSMVSLPMMAKLLAAVRPSARLVLVGDPDQLVSIEAGSVLGDLVGPEGADGSGPLAGRVKVLDRVFRFEEDSGIADLADAVRSGDADAAMDVIAAGAVDVQWVDTSAGSDAAEEVLERLRSHARNLAVLGAGGNTVGALEALGGLAVLCAHRRGPAGVEHWNPAVEEAVRPSGRRNVWYPGRPVMVTANDYRLNLFNGDIGVVVEDEGHQRVAFRGPDGPRLVGPAQLSDTETVHALTIHKSQGSQFDEVVVILPDEASRLLTRELLYTAVTRAKHKVTLVGGEAAIRAAIDRRVTRSSGLADALWG